jgi:hypothetical protein
MLVGALVHRPFMSTPEKKDLDEDQAQEPEATQQAGSPLEANTADLPDRGRVADLIARQQRDAS